MKLVHLLAWGCVEPLARPVAAQGTYLDPTFQRPVILNGTSTGTVRDVVQQPDGKYVIGGTFSSINGVRARNLARLNADGTLDAAFTANCSASGTVYSVALEPAGNILVGGSFDSLAAARRRGVARLQPSGVLDATFDAGINSALTISQVASMPGGDVLALVGQPSSTAPPKSLYRLKGQTGQDDPAFQQAVQLTQFAVQADGRIVTAGGNGSYVLLHLLARLLPTGALDPSYTPRTTYYSSPAYKVEVDASNNSYRLGGGNELRGLTGPGITFNDWGALNPRTFQRQPNGRFLVAGSGSATQPATARLLPNGQQDASYQPAAGPTIGEVLRILVQPNGALVMAGSFERAGTTPTYGLVRLLDANVLASKNPAAASRTTIWPVPAENVVNVQLDVAAGPQQVQVLDGLGQAVLTRVVPPNTGTLALNVAALPASIYTVRVCYGQASAVVRRLVVRH